MAFDVGARGPHDGDRPAAGALDGEIHDLALGQQSITVAATYLPHVPRLYRLRRRLLRPRHPRSPDRGQGAAGFGRWAGDRTPGQWDGCPRPACSTYVAGMAGQGTAEISPSQGKPSCAVMSRSAWR